MQVNSAMPSEHLAAVGQTIRRGRKDRGLSIDQAAALARMSAPTWGGVERGAAARPSTYQAMGSALGIAPELIGQTVSGVAGLDKLDDALRRSTVDLSRIPHAALLAELDRRLSAR